MGCREQSSLNVGFRGGPQVSVHVPSRVLAHLLRRTSADFSAQTQELMMLPLLSRVCGRGRRAGVWGSLLHLPAIGLKQSRACFLPRSFPVLPSRGLRQPGAKWGSAQCL